MIYNLYFTSGNHFGIFLTSATIDQIPLFELIIGIMSNELIMCKLIGAKWCINRLVY